MGNQVKTFGQAFVRRGHQVTVIALAQPGAEALTIDDGIRVFRVQPGSLHWYTSNIPTLGNWFALAIRELEYGWAVWRQLEELHSEAPFDLIEGTETGAFWATHLSGDLPFIVRLHGEHFTYHKHTPDLTLSPGIVLSRILQRRAIRRSDLMTSPSRAHACEIANELKLNNEHEHQIRIVPNAIAHSRLEQGNDRGVLFKGRNGPTVLYVGRLQRVKGIPLLLEAAAQVVQAMPSTRFLFAGANHPDLAGSTIDSLVKRYSLQGHVQFLGHVPREMLSHLYREASITVLPSFYETFGLAALESLAHGTPVVATAVGGLPELIQDETMGKLVPAGDLQALSTAIICLLREDPLREAMGLAGRRSVRERFDVDLVIDEMIAAYQHVLGG